MFCHCNELGVNIRILSRTAIEKMGDLLAMLNELEPGDVYLLMKFIVYPVSLKKCYIQQWKILCGYYYWRGL